MERGGYGQSTMDRIDEEHDPVEFGLIFTFLVAVQHGPERTTTTTTIKQQQQQESFEQSHSPLCSSLI